MSDYAALDPTYRISIGSEVASFFNPVFIFPFRP